MCTVRGRGGGGVFGGEYSVYGGVFLGIVRRLLQCISGYSSASVAVYFWGEFGVGCSVLLVRVRRLLQSMSPLNHT